MERVATGESKLAPCLVFHASVAREGRADLLGRDLEGVFGRRDLDRLPDLVGQLQLLTSAARCSLPEEAVELTNVSGPSVEHQRAREIGGNAGLAFRSVPPLEEALSDLRVTRRGARQEMPRDERHV